MVIQMRTVAEVSGCLIYQFELDGKTYLASSEGGIIEHKPLTSGEDLVMAELVEEGGKLRTCGDAELGKRFMEAE